VDTTGLSPRIIKTRFSISSTRHIKSTWTHTLATMARRSSHSLSGLFALLLVLLLATPTLAAWNQAYCSKQNTADTDVCKSTSPQSLTHTNVPQTPKSICPMATAPITAERRAPLPSRSSSTRTATAPTTSLATKKTSASVVRAVLVTISRNAAASMTVSSSTSRTAPRLALRLHQALRNQPKHLP